MTASLPGDGRPTPGCCAAIVGDDCSRPRERWCMRRRRKKWCAGASVAQDEGVPHRDGGCEPWCPPGTDYCYRCGGAGDECDTVVRPAGCPPRRGTRGAAGETGGVGEPSFVREFLAGPALPERGVEAAAPASSGRGGDGSRARFLEDFHGRLCGVADERPTAGRSCGPRRTSRGPLGGRILLWWLLLATAALGASGSIMGDGCNWSGSGLEAEQEAARGDGGGVGVRPVYLRCSQGAVSWAYPRGALRVLLRLAGGGGGDFRGCVRLGRTWRGARLFLAGPRSLHPLFPEVDAEAPPKGGSRVSCFQSRGGQAALYVEATPGGLSPRGRTVASFEYHLQPLPTGVKSFDPSEECRPCTLEEMTHAFCSSDLVTRGTIRSVETHDDPETSQLKVRVTKLIRHTRAPPPPLEGDPFEDEDGGRELQEEAPNRLGATGRRRHRDGATGHHGGVSVTLNVAAHCGVRHGAGEFVFMAQRKLGQLRLRCAPRLEDWAELAAKSNRQAESPCVLQA